MNIQEIWQKIKNITEDVVSEWGLMVIVFLVAIASFGLGRLSTIEEARPAVSIREAQTSAAAQKAGFVPAKNCKGLGAVSSQ